MIQKIYQNNFWSNFVMQKHFDRDFQSMFGHSIIFIIGKSIQFTCVDEPKFKLSEIALNSCEIHIEHMYLSFPSAVPLRPHPLRIYWVFCLADRFPPCQIQLIPSTWQKDTCSLSTNVSISSQ